MTCKILKALLMLNHGITESWRRAVCFIVRFTFSDRNDGIFDNRAPPEKKSFTNPD